MDDKYMKKVEKNIHALTEKHALGVKLSLDGEDVLEAQIRKGTIYLDSKNTLRLLTAPELLKIGLALRGMFGKNYRIRMKSGFIKRILGKR